jgi:hypothetical protein
MADSEPTQTAAAQRALVGVRRRRRLFQYATDLNRLRREYPELIDLINEHVADTLDHARRTRTAERAAVLNALRRWGSPGLTVADLLDETELSAWTLRSLLRELAHETPPVIGYAERTPAGGRGRPQRIYFLRAEVGI